MKHSKTGDMNIHHDTASKDTRIDTKTDKKQSSRRDKMSKPKNDMASM